MSLLTIKAAAAIELKRAAPIMGAARSKSRTVLDRTCINEEIEMLGTIARWGHNILLTAMGLLTLALLAFWLGNR
jgi:hypothetical protein